MFMSSARVVLIALLHVTSTPCLFAQQLYFPPPGKDWKDRDPKELGMDDKKLEKAIDFALANENGAERDLRVAILRGMDREPFHKIVGQTKKRGGPAGMVLKDGHIVGQWGDTRRVDMTFSVTKSYLSTIAGLALDAGLIAEVTDSVKDYVWQGAFDGHHNSKITWHHLLNQSSDWYGDLFGLPDWADRPPEVGGIDDWKRRELKEPGTAFKYNDVRVNLLAYSLLQVWRKPLPQVLKERIMDPIGASTSWRWHGYSTSWVEVDGLKMQSVSGGGHSGGGLFISTQDHARFGLLFLAKVIGRGTNSFLKNGFECCSNHPKQTRAMVYIWWLNRGDSQWEGLSDQIYYAAGFGGNFIIVDQAHNLVFVTRWLDPSKIGEMVKLVLDSVQ